ncbi:hypothetical protein [Aeromonas sp. R1-1]|uniref:hypothetical protein n=1 Tax=Aeromonas sp. R1-1 TaxID=3138455 RepID=UPI0034A2551E
MINTIGEILHEKVKLALTITEKGSFLRLSESSPGSKVQSVDILEIPDDSLAFTLDHDEPNDRSFKKLSSYFNPENGIGINKSCDLVVFTLREVVDIDEVSKKAKADILIADLKSDTLSIRGEIQIENSILFVNYLIQLCKYYYHLDISPNFIRRIITTQAIKSPIGRDRNINRGQLRAVPITVDKQKKCAIRYSRIIS